MSEQITVRRVQTEEGSHIEPPLDGTWDDLTTLRWQAAVVRTDTGLNVDVEPAKYSRKVGETWVPIPDLYNIRYQHGCMGAYSFAEAWALLTGVDLGSRLARGA